MINKVAQQCGTFPSFWTKKQGLSPWCFRKKVAPLFSQSCTLVQAVGLASSDKKE